MKSILKIITIFVICFGLIIGLIRVEIACSAMYGTPSIFDINIKMVKN